MRSTDFDHKTTVIYSGPYWDYSGQRQAQEIPLLYLSEELADPEGTGLLVDTVFAAPPEKIDGTDEQDIVAINLSDWLRVACEQTGGHNFTDWIPNEEYPESAGQICTRCFYEKLS